jgi:hypothetical protein
MPRRPSLAALLLLLPAVATAGVPVSYQLPPDGPLPKTYRVTLAITDPTNADWIVSTFLSGEPRTVTAENKGRFTDAWDGLDDNRLPLPAGPYAVKGIYLPAEKWAIDGQYHALTLDYVAGAGDSWTPPKGEGHRSPPIFGYGFGLMQDVSVGPDGRAGFVAKYLENAFNPFLVDLTRPVGVDQVLAKFDSHGIGGGEAVACDGEYLFVAQHWDGVPSLYRANDKNVWGPTVFGWNMCKGYQFEKLTEIRSLAAWKREPDAARFLYVAHQNLFKAEGVIRTYDGNTAAPLGASAAVPELRAITLDRRDPGSRLYGLYQVSNAWTVGTIALAEGVPTGDWQPSFTVTGIASPADMEMDAGGRFYISDMKANRVYRLDATGAIVHTYGGSGVQQPGRYDPDVFMSPRHLAVWRDAQGNDRLLVVEAAGPGRVSEWRPDGTRIRQWFFLQPSVLFGYGADPTDPTALYAPANSPVTGKGFNRFRLDYATGAWTCDAVWPDIPHPLGYPQIRVRQGVKILAFAGRTAEGQPYCRLFRAVSNNWVFSAGLVRQANTANYRWWHDADGDGRPSPAEYAAATPATDLRLGQYGAVFTEDFALLAGDISLSDPWGGYATGRKYQIMRPTGFDAHGNPIYDGVYRDLFVDDVLEARAAGTATRLRGGNELWPPTIGSGEAAGSDADGYFHADSSGLPATRGYGEGGTSFGQFKLKRFAPDGQGGYRQVWRAGRKALTGWEANGRVFRALHVTAPAHGLVGVMDLQGLYHVYTDDGLFVETLIVAPHTLPQAQAGMYMQEQGSWTGQHFLNRDNNKVYLLMNRTALGVCEVKGWTPNAIQRIASLPARVTLTPRGTSPADPEAVLLRGGYGVAPVMRIPRAPTGGPALDGTATGWEACATPATITHGGTHTAKMQALHNDENLYLRWHVRQPQAVAPKPLGDPTRLFTAGAGHLTMSLYLQGDLDSAAPGAREGRPGDLRLCFALVQDGAVAKPMVLALMPLRARDDATNGVTYAGASGTTVLGRVALRPDIRLRHALDPDGLGFTLTAAIPRNGLLPWPALGGVVTTMNADATFDGATRAWWARTEPLPDTTRLDDDALAAAFFPGAWGQAWFDPAR